MQFSWIAHKAVLLWSSDIFATFFIFIFLNICIYDDVKTKLRVAVSYLM